MPVWIFITTPLLYSGLFLLGALAILYTILQQKWRLYTTPEQRQDVLFLASFLVPAVIGLHSVLYDAWRQLFFVYPGFVLVATRGFVVGYSWLKKQAFSPNWAPVIWVSITIFSVGHTVYVMGKIHPYQNNYFSCLTPGKIETSFERDYWGSAYREALEFTLQYDKSPVVYMACATHSGAWLSTLLLPPEQQKRLRWVEVPATDEAQPSSGYRPVYFLTNYRWHPGPYPYRHEILARRVNGVKILSVFKIP